MITTLIRVVISLLSYLVIRREAESEIGFNYQVVSQKPFIANQCSNT